MLVTRLLAAALSLFLVATLAACDTGDPGETPSLRGSIIRVDSLGRASLDDLRSDNLLAPEPTYEVALYSLVYRTVDPSGNAVEASGALAIPRDAPGAAVPDTLPLLSYQHGTNLVRDSVASQQGFDDEETAGISLVFASQGYVTALPDYLGLGVSEELHPYVVPEAYETAVIDFLRAARQFAEERGLALADELFLAGYSEGGYATAVVQRALQEKPEYDGEFSVTASAPMAGPYDLSGTMTETLLAAEPYSAPYLLPYLVLSYDDAYDLYDDPAEVFAAPYDKTVPPLFDGETSADVISEALPEVPRDVLDSAFVASFQRDSANAFRQALRQNDQYRWTPQAPTALIHYVQDELVPFRNSVVADSSFQARGAAAVQLLPIPVGICEGHTDCAGTAFVFGQRFFEGVRNQEPHRARRGGGHAFFTRGSRPLTARERSEAFSSAVARFFGGGRLILQKAPYLFIPTPRPCANSSSPPMT